ncbi:MAG: Nif3-like dinuclear metal center hexameric protein [Bacteroidales bacterium]|nr:Nif3-like dinuclear metal center hexameric protein [Bacteroidales bacterium]
MKIKDIAEIIESHAPSCYAEAWDNVGLLVGNREDAVTKVITTLDVTEEVIDLAIASGAEMIVSHHPLIFDGLKKIVFDSHVSRLIMKAIKHNIAIYAAHTNLDNAFNGLNYYVAGLLNVKNCTVLEATYRKLFKLVTFVPIAQMQKVRNAIFDSGAGCIGEYGSCSYNTHGVGTFKAGANTHPFVGEIGETHEENEARLEIIVPEHLLSHAIRNLVKAHPYEEPAFDVIAVENKNQQYGSGIIGNLSLPLSEQDFLSFVKEKLEVPALRFSKLTGNMISRVAICTGAGAFLKNKAISMKADAFITGDVKYHEFLDLDAKMLLIDAGHYETERMASKLLSEIINSSTSEVAVETVAPNYVFVK